MICPICKGKKIEDGRGMCNGCYRDRRNTPKELRKPLPYKVDRSRKKKQEKPTRVRVDPDSFTNWNDTAIFCL